jgi:4a-hydroxytetrahydrobiopterin dehydratase
MHPRGAHQRYQQQGSARVAALARLPDNEFEANDSTNEERSMPALSKDEVKARIADFPGWKRDDDEIEKEYKFADFKEAMAFVNRVADLAETANHHPEIEINYNRVEISLSTHSEGGVTEKDFALAAQIDGVGPAGGSAA